VGFFDRNPALDVPPGPPPSAAVLPQCCHGTAAEPDGA
jgi:hypothetical protein